MDWNNCFSGKRYGVETGPSEIRSEFERDYDRIIFSSAFRRLQNKTQVFPLPKHVFVHNRLTHSLEVACIGRSLGKIVGAEITKIKEVEQNKNVLDFYKDHLKNVISAACLAHDLGNPAFGHSGEEAISKHFLDKKDDKKFTSQFSVEEWDDLIKFEGNANSLRVLTRKSSNNLDGGYRLTYSTLASIMKYPCAANESKGKKGPTHLKKYGYFQADKKVFDAITKEVKMINDADNGNAFFRHPFTYLVEAADDIAYNIIDFEDAHRLGILTTEEITSIFLDLLKLSKNDNFSKTQETATKLDSNPNEKISYLRAKAINFLTISSAQVFIDNADKIIKGEFEGSLVQKIPDAQTILEKIETISVNRIYNHNSVVKIELAGFKIMSALISDFVEAVLMPKSERIKRHDKIIRLIPNQYLFNETNTSYEKVMCILDLMSGMTDLYALELYRNLQGISMPSI